MFGIFGGKKTKDSNNDSSLKIAYVNVTDEDLSSQHALIDAFIKSTADDRHWYGCKLNDFDVGKEIAVSDAAQSRLFVLAVISRLIPIDKKANTRRKLKPLHYFQDKTYSKCWDMHNQLDIILRALLRRKLPFTLDDILCLLDYLKLSIKEGVSCFFAPLSGIVKSLEDYEKVHGLTDDMQKHLKKVIKTFAASESLGVDERKILVRLLALLGENCSLNLQAGEAWSDAAIADINALDNETRHAWVDLLVFCQSATSSKPTAKWKKEGKPLLQAIDMGLFKEFIPRWFALTDKPRTQEISSWSQWSPNPNLMLNEQNMDILKGLVWCCMFDEADELAKAIKALAISAYKKVPGIGPRAVRVGNACVLVLGEMPGMVGVYQLALLKVRINYRTALKGIEKALTTAGKRVGMSIDELEEIGVPAYGLTEVGKLNEQIGDFTAELLITSTNTTELRWQKADGKAQKTVPKGVKDNFTDELKDLKTNIKDIQKMLPAQRQRLDNLFLQQRQWDYDKWRDNYLNHPLVGYLARRLIWKLTTADQTTLAIWHEEHMVDVHSQIVNIKPETRVALWHPIESEVEVIQAWRERLDEKQVIQPFKQAHREIYLLTDAERQTQIYSNRFAAHIIRQHQFNALAATRGWRYALQGCWDGSEEIARLVLPKWGIWAEFWVDGVGEYGADTTEAGVFNYVSTDQVRFYAYGSADDVNNIAWNRQEREEGAMPLEDIPILLMSEVFRDVDMFVGVASVGNDPEWSDGGPEGQYRDYWTSYSFGDLNASAKTRKEVLERLIPRLKIADRCELTDKFLVVKGDIRSYKIHLGSGNILMTPNDQYLCIVVARGKTGNDGKIFLPFEGDNILSIILSKAFMLAEDKKIKDSTIISQINP